MRSIRVFMADRFGAQYPQDCRRTPAAPVQRTLTMRLLFFTVGLFGLMVSVPVVLFFGAVAWVLLKIALT